jgi:hypothetical protein
MKTLMAGFATMPSLPSTGKMGRREVSSEKGFLLPGHLAQPRLHLATVGAPAERFVESERH